MGSLPLKDPAARRRSALAEAEGKVIGAISFEAEERERESERLPIYCRLVFELMFFFQLGGCANLEKETPIPSIWGVSG